MQKVIDCVVVHVLQMFDQIGTRAVRGGTHQILNVLLLGNHTGKMLFFTLKRKSWYVAFIRGNLLVSSAGNTKGGMA